MDCISITAARDPPANLLTEPARRRRVVWLIGRRILIKKLVTS